MYILRDLLKFLVIKKMESKKMKILLQHQDLQSAKNFNYTVIIKCIHIHNCNNVTTVIPFTENERDYTFNL